MKPQNAKYFRKELHKYLGRHDWEHYLYPDELWTLARYRQALEHSSVEDHEVFYGCLFEAYSMGEVDWCLREARNDSENSENLKRREALCHYDTEMACYGFELSLFSVEFIESIDTWEISGNFLPDLRLQFGDLINDTVTAVRIAYEAVRIAYEIVDGDAKDVYLEWERRLNLDDFIIKRINLGFIVMADEPMFSAEYLIEENVVSFLEMDLETIAVCDGGLLSEKGHHFLSGRGNENRD